MGEKVIVQPPYRRGGEGAMLCEALPEIACVLWQFVRHVRDWAESTEAQRRLLFVPEVSERVVRKWRDAEVAEPDIAPAVEVLATFTRDQGRVQAIAAAAETIARWAEQREYRESAIQMAEAAALLGQREPRLANLAGRLTRTAGDYTRAEIWFERGIGLARTRREWVEYTRGHLGAGILAMELGRESRARRHFNTASNIAMREGHEWLAAEAQHDLFQFVTMRGNYVDAEVHARRALTWYPKHHPRFPFFAADVGFLLVLQRQFRTAVPILRQFVRIIKPPQNVLGYSVLVRALAGAGQASEFERRRDRLQKLLANHSAWEAAARWNLAHAERERGNVDAALAEVVSAARLARVNGDRETQRLAEDLLQELEAGAQPAPSTVKRREEHVSPLVTTLAARLAEWSPTRRGRTPLMSRADWAA